MPPANLRSGALLSMQTLANRHLRLSGASDWKTSLVYLVLCAQWIFVASRQVRSPLPLHREPLGSLLVYAFGSVVLARLAADAVGCRDRFVLLLGLLRFAMDFLIGVTPNRVQPLVHAMRDTSLALSIVAALASASLLRSAIRTARTR